MIRISSILPLFLAFCTGCHVLQQRHPVVGERFVESADVVDCEEPCASPSCATPAQPNITVNFPKEICLKQPAAPKKAPPEPKRAVQATTQETLLVPRMVYVPYAPQVPVAPARLVGAQPVAFGTQFALPGQAPPSRAPAAAQQVQPQVTVDQFMQLANAVEKLALTVKDLQCAPAPVPSAGKGRKP